MKEHNKIRLKTMAARFAPQAVEQSEAERDAEREARFLAAFARVRDEAIRPVMEEVGVELRNAGHDYRIERGTPAAPSAIDLRVFIRGRSGYKDTVRFFPRKDEKKGWQVVGEIELKRAAVEITRFEEPEQISRDVAEQLIVDAVEQIFASTEGGVPPAASV